jgi:hypothetical protein
MTDPDLETLAQSVAQKTGAPIEAARVGVRVTLAKMKAALDGDTDAANKYLRPYGVRLTWGSNL